MKAVEFFTTPEGKKYLEMFQGETFVLKYGGAALETPEMMGYFLEDVAEMKKHGINIVIIHGGGKALSARMEQEKIPVVFVGVSPEHLAAVSIGVRYYRSSLPW